MKKKGARLKGDKGMSFALQKNKRRRYKPKRILTFFLLVLFIIGAVFYSQLGAVASNDCREEVFDVEKGSTPVSIAHQLYKKGFIKSEKAFLMYARFVGKLDKMKAGQYLIDTSMNTPEIINILVAGKVVTVTFTIPEGYTLDQIAEVLIKKGFTTKEEFWQVVKTGDFKYDFMKDLPKGERRLEGFLFPDTYVVAKGMDAERVINVMLNRFKQVIDELPDNNTRLSLYELVTLASIVEGESLLDEDRPVIASVFYNRLKIDMKLDSCATIQYALGDRKKRLLNDDLKIDSKYNTYTNKGLPPGPIGSPGKASLEAVLEPAQTNYFYSVAKKDGSGKHVFARTHQEHVKNKYDLGY